MRALKRVVVPEILDSLPAGDPRARRSRRDLLAVDAFMGNTRWILRKIQSLPASGGAIVEIGAGEGLLAGRFCKAFPSRGVVGLDLAKRPPNLDRRVDWVSGDFFQTMPNANGEICAGSLILHHFSEGALRELGRRMRDFRTLVFSEPLRSRVSLGFSALAQPFAGEVTRHDMPASIRAGFALDELPRWLGIEASQWNWSETATLRGGLRFFATRRA